MLLNNREILAKLRNGKFYKIEKKKIERFENCVFILIIITRAYSHYTRKHT